MVLLADNVPNILPMQQIPRLFNKPILWPLLLLVAPFLLFWRWLVFGEVLYWGTLLLQFWPWRQLVKSSLLAGDWPLWNPLLGNGAPLLANQQSAVFYPPNLLYLLLPVEQALTLSVVVHLALAGGLMYAFARQLGLPPFAAAISALSYMFSGYLVGRTQFVVMINAAAWLPLLLLLGERLATRRRWPDAVWLALALALQLLAGHSQLWFYSLLLLAAYILFRSWQQHRTGPLPWRQAAMPLMALAAAVIVALLLSAAQLLPTAEFVAQSPRSSGAARYEALTYSYWPWRLITLLAPDFFGSPAWGNYWGYANYWEDHAYQGVLPLLFALLATAAAFKRHAKNNPAPKVPPVVPFFAPLALISLLLAMGWNTPLYPFLFDTVPGFGLFRAPARLLIWYTVAVSLLAGLGAARFELTPASRRNWRRLLAGAVALTVAGLAGGLLLAGRSLTFVGAAQKAGLLLAVGIGLLLLQPRPAGTLRRARWQALVALFVAADLLAAALPLIPMLPPAIFTRPIAGAEAVQAQPGPHQRILTDPDFAHAATFEHYFRFDAFGPTDPAKWQPYRETLSANFGVYAGLPAANNNDPLVIGHQQALLDALRPENAAQYRRVLAVLGVSHRVSGADDPLPTGPEIFSDGQTAIRAVADALPRAYVVGQGIAAPNFEAALSALLAPNFDPRREVVIMEAAGSLPAAPGTAAFAPAAVDTDLPRQVSLRAETSAPGWLVLTDSWYPGWQATINGQPAAIWQANAAFRAVWLAQAGSHRVEFVYRPRAFTAGLWISLVTVLILILLALAAARRAAAPERTSP
ncbi:MAG: hypothetical protein Kow0031_27920 [Anaerolineae bacterium]